MKNRTKNILSFMLAFIMVLSVSINVFAAEEQPVDSRFLPQVNYVEDNQIARVPNAIPITVNPYYNKLVVHVGNIGVDSLDSVTVGGSATALSHPKRILFHQLSEKILHGIFRKQNVIWNMMLQLIL